MGCGCRKSRKTSISLTVANAQNITAAQKKALRDASIRRANKALAKAKASKQQKDIQINRKTTCAVCPHAVFNSKASDNKFKLCEKCNRPLFVIAKDMKFACPIGKFQAAL